MQRTEIHLPLEKQSDGEHTGYISLPDFIFDVAAKEVGIPLFSDDFVWARTLRDHRFGVVLGGLKRLTLLEGVVHSHLSPQKRAAMFPSAYHPGSDQVLERGQSTYQAIADAVARTCSFNIGDLEEKFVKQTANALADLTGFSVADLRDADPVRFARTVWLFVYLKKTRGSGIVGMLKAPEANAKPSLEVTNPYHDGYLAQADKRMDFHDVQTYLALQLPPAMRVRLEKCLPCLMSAMEGYIAAIVKEARSASLGQNDSTAVRIDHLRAAKHFYGTHLENLLEISNRTVKPLDETLYLHARTLEVRHYAAFRTILKARASQRPDMPPLSVVGLDTAPPQRLEAIDLENSVESYRRIAERLFKRPVHKAEVLKATQLARHVLRHYLPFATSNLQAIDQPIPFPTMFAAVMYSLQLDNDPAAFNYNPHIYGQGRVPTSIITAINSEPNDRHEEYEHIIVDAIDWYKAAILNLLPLQRALLEMRDVIEQGVARLCATNDLVVLEKVLGFMRQAPSVRHHVLTCPSQATRITLGGLFNPWRRAAIEETGHERVYQVRGHGCAQGNDSGVSCSKQRGGGSLRW